MIEMEELHYRYPEGPEDTLKGLSFSIPPGEIFGLLGPSGVGKSTLVKVLIGVLPGWSGKLSVAGTRPGKGGREFYEEMGVAFEYPAFYGKLTARENLRFFKSLYRKETEPVDQLLGELGLQEHRDKRVSDYSKGMKTRLNLCRALLPRPRLLILDEPTSGLDPSNAALVKELIRRKREEGVTVLLTTHNMHVAEELCDRVALMADGSFSALDAPGALCRSLGSASVVLEFPDGREHFPLAGLRQNEEFLAALERRDLLRIHSEEPTLEAVFIKLTGRGLAE